MIILPKFHDDLMKFEDFFLMGNFWKLLEASGVFYFAQTLQIAK